MNKTCQVCQVAPVSARYFEHPACEACISFFRRNFDKADSLKCLSGTDCCAVSSNDVSKNHTLSNGNLWRFSCKKCRLAKCFATGMKMKGQKRKFSATTNDHFKEDNSTPAKSIEHIESTELVKSEVIINKLVLAYYDYSGVIQNLPGRSVLLENSDGVSKLFNDNFNQTCRSLVQFIKGQPVFERTQLSQRCQLFFRGLGRSSTLMQSVLPGGATPMGMNEHNFKILTESFPELAVSSMTNFTFVLKKNKVRFSLLGSRKWKFFHSSFLG